MNSIASAFIKCKIGVRDVQKIPAYTEITTKELLIFIITFEVEKVVKQVWYNSASKRQVEEQEGRAVGEDEDDLNRATKRGRDNLNGKQNINLGSLSLAQYAAAKNARKDNGADEGLKGDNFTDDMEINETNNRKEKK